MKPSVLRILLSIAIASGAAGCGVTFDTAYLIGDQKRITRNSDDRQPTGHQDVAVEYELGAAQALQCVSRTRQVERTQWVQKTYELRNGYGPSTYKGAAIASGIMGALVGGVILGICNSEDSDLSCTNALWAAPFAVDTAYSLLRSSMAREPVLVRKSRRSDALDFGAPIAEQPVGCESVESVWVGHAQGDSRAQLLNRAGVPQTLREGAVPLAVHDAEGAQYVALTAEAASKWLRDPVATLLVRRTDGVVAPLRNAVRCDVLRNYAQVTNDKVSEVATACPPVAPTGNLQGQPAASSGAATLR